MAQIRRRRQRTPGSKPVTQRWPETWAELNSLPPLNKPLASEKPVISTETRGERARPLENAQTAPAFPDPAILEAQRVQKARDAILNSPYLTLDGNVLTVRKPIAASSTTTGPFGQTSPQKQRSFLGATTRYNAPDPAPGPPPQPNQEQTKPQPNNGMIDPALLEAQKAYDKMITGMIDPALLEAQRARESGYSTGGTSGSHSPRIYGWTEYDVPEADRKRWENQHDPDYYISEYDKMDLTPGDMSYKNPYGIDIDNFLHWAYSQLGYHEKSSGSADLSVMSDDNDGSGNYTKYGEVYGVNGQAWCAAFASWCADKANIPKDKIFRNTSTNGLINSYMDAGRFQPKESYIPKAGDLILCQTVKDALPDKDGLYHGKWDKNAKGQYYWVGDGGRYNLDGHTGIVVGYAVKDGIRYVYTIEGNVANGIVKFNERKIDADTYIKGFGVNGGRSLGFIPPQYR